ncbi:MarR family winged helix-turn-helix transcriptional regulator [Gemella cuniculi]|uniref:MarR family winged helix-turn-helix transcriptional regulator n=1 Tax=Gemella cuniculi TaxID=150240 RepID=UPI00040084CC|nr:MarR family transcriptional regulator [Gemella cuniculi]
MEYDLKDNLNTYAMVVFRKAQKSIDEKLIISIKENGLTFTQFGVLDVLYNKGELKIGELIEKMLTTSGNMTCVIKNMENAELVYRKKDEQDKRAFKIGLTSKGKNIIEKVLPIHIKNIEDTFRVLTNKEKQTLITILKKFKDDGGQ